MYIGDDFSEAEVEEIQKGEAKPSPSFFPTNKELGIVMHDDASKVPPIPSYGGKE